MQKKEGLNILLYLVVILWPHDLNIKPMKTLKNSWNGTPFAFPVSPDRDFPKSFQTEKSLYTVQLYTD